MDIRKCFQTLDLLPSVTLAEVKQAYRYLARVWHPDRFSGQPALQAKAARKLQEINDCYRMVTAFLNAGRTLTQASKTPTENRPAEKIRHSKTRVDGRFAELSEATDRAHAALLKEKSPYRFCVYQDKNETFIDIVLLDMHGKIKEIKKNNITEKDFFHWMHHIERGEGLLIDIST